MEMQRTRRTRVGLVKAVLGELRHNAGVCVGIRYGGPPSSNPGYSTDTWEAARFELAQFVPDKIFEDLLFIYEDMLPRVQSLVQAWGNVWPDAGIDSVVGECDERMKRAMKELLSLRYSGSFRNRWQIRLEGEDQAVGVHETEVTQT